MHAPITLIIPAALLGVIVPTAFMKFAAHSDYPVAAGLLAVGSLAIIPVLATAIAYRQGYDRGLANGRKSEEGQAR